MEPTETTPYFESQQFTDDRNALADSRPDGVDPARWAICLKWSDNLIAMGGFPSAEQSEVMATFAIGDLSVDDLIEELRVDAAAVAVFKNDLALK